MRSKDSIRKNPDITRFLSDRYNSEGRRHSYGWKRKGKLKEDVNIEELKQAYIKAGWKTETR